MKSDFDGFWISLFQEEQLLLSHLKCVVAEYLNAKKQLRETDMPKVDILGKC